MTVRVCVTLADASYKLPQLAIDNRATQVVAQYRIVRNSHNHIVAQLFTPGAQQVVKRPRHAPSAPTRLTVAHRLIPF